MSQTITARKQQGKIYFILYFTHDLLANPFLRAAKPVHHLQKQPATNRRKDVSLFRQFHYPFEL